MADIINRYELRGTDKTKKAVNSATRGFRKLDNVVKSVGAGIAAFTIGRFIGESIKAIDQVNKLSDRLNVSVRDFSRLSFAAEQTGVNVRTLSLGLQRLQRRVSEAAQGTGEAQGALRELGIDAEKLNRLRPEQQFQVLAAAFESVANQSDRTRLAFKLFDSEGVALLQTLGLGEEGIRRLKAEADALGITLDQNTADAASEAADAVNRLRAQSRALAVQFVKTFGPAISTSLTKLTQLFKQFEIAGTELAVSFARIAVKFNRLFGNDKNLKEAELRFVLLKDRVFELRKEIEALAAGGGTNFGALTESIKAGEFFDLSLKGKTGKSGEETARKEAEALAKRNALIAEGEQLYRQTLTPIQEVANRFARLEQLREANVITEEKYLAVLQATSEEYQKLASGTDEAVEKQKTLLDTLKDKSNDVANGIVQVFSDAEKSIGDILTSIGQDIAQSLFARFVTSQLASGIGDFLEGQFGRATGGPVKSGQAVTVGEQGPETFVPNVAGQVVPSASGGGDVAINIYAIDTQTGTEFLIRNKNTIKGIIAQANTRAGNRPGFA